MKEIAENIGAEPQEVQEALQKLEQLDIVQRALMSMFVGSTEPMLKRFISYQHDFEIRQLSKEQMAENIKTEIRTELRRMTNLVGRFAEIVVGCVMKGFNRQTLDGPRFFSTSEPVFVPYFSHIENRWSVIANDTVEALDLIGEYRVLDEEKEEYVTSAWFVQVKYRQDKVTKPNVRKFLAQSEETVKGYANLTHWYVSKGGFYEPAKALLSELGIYHSDLAQFNELAKEFDYLGFPEKVRG